MMLWYWVQIITLAMIIWPILKSVQAKHRNPVTTGWDEMDDITSGGLGRNELGVVIAPTGVGKSMVLVHLEHKRFEKAKMSSIIPKMTQLSQTDMTHV